MTQPEQSQRIFEDFIPLADVSHFKRKWLDLAYANYSQSQNLDIYLPEEGDGPYPVILYLHGGAFSIGDKRDIFVLNMLKCIKRGYALVSVNYRDKNLDAVRAFINEHEMNWDHIVADKLLMQEFGNPGFVPCGLLFDQNGNLIKYKMSPKDVRRLLENS